MVLKLMFPLTVTKSQMSSTEKKQMQDTDSENEKTETLLYHIREPKNKKYLCCCNGCKEAIVVWDKVNQRGYCEEHYNQIGNVSKFIRISKMALEIYLKITKAGMSLGEGWTMNYREGILNVRTPTGIRPHHIKARINELYIKKLNIL